MEDLPIDFIDSKSESKKPKAYKVIVFICAAKIILSIVGLVYLILMRKEDVIYLMSSISFLIKIFSRDVLPIITLVLFLRGTKAGWFLISFLNFLEIFLLVIYITQMYIMQTIYSDIWILLFPNAIFILISAVVIYLNFKRSVTEFFEGTNKMKWFAVLSALIVAGSVNLYLYEVISRL